MINRETIIQALQGTGVNESKIAEILGGLTAEEQQWAIQMLREHMEKGASDTLAKLYSIDFVRQPVSIEQFITDPFYLGTSCEGIYPVWRKELNHVFRAGTDTFEWIFCVTGDTPVAMCDGTTPSIQELSETKGENEKFWIWSHDKETGRVIPAEARYPHKTGRDVVYKITLDNGTYFRANAKHQMLTRDGELIMVKDMSPGETRLMPFSRTEGQGALSGYRRIYQHNKKDYDYEHHLIAEDVHGIDRKARGLVIGVEECGEEDVYCLTVDKTGLWQLCCRDLETNEICWKAGLTSSNTGAIRCGKTYVASVACAYKLYVLSCTKNPQTYLGLGDPNTAIYFGVFSVRLSEAEETAFDYIKQFVDHSPYFRKYFPRNNKINYRLEFPHRIRVNFGSKELHALGRAIIVCIIDEANFMKGGAIGDAYKLYYQVRARITGQYGYRGYNPGLLCVISSRNTESDFLEKHIERFAGERGVHLSDYALWETKPPENYCGETFKVAVGNKYKQSRILAVGEEDPEEQHVIDVPVEHRVIFENNIEQAIRDLAGVPIYAVSNYLQDRTKLVACANAEWEHPFTLETLELDYLKMPKISDWFKIRDVCKVVGSRYVPKLNPEVNRFAHVDLALNGDAAGIAVVHSAGMRKESIKIRDELGYSVSTFEVNVDFMLRIKASPGSEIDISAIREFFVYLRRNGFMFNKITYDGYQSASSVQDLMKVGLNTDRQSVDRNSDAYDYLRDLLMEERIHMYKYDPFVSEAGQLQRIIKGRKSKIDHPPDKSKDVSDAVAGAVFLCAKDNATYPFHQDKPQFKNSNEKLVQKALNLKKRTDDGYITGIQGGESIEWDY
jgi:hypothetical protein